MQLSPTILRANTANGPTVRELVCHRRGLLIFLRHFGCLFCREAIADTLAVENELADRDVTPIFVHQSSPESAMAMFAKYKYAHAHTISDPKRKLYEEFQLGRARWGQVFGLPVWQRGWNAFFQGGHRVGMLEGNGFQMGGYFLVEDNEVIEQHKLAHAGERINLLAFVDQREDYLTLAAGPLQCSSAACVPVPGG
jgi:hypothetical protein